ncbi:MAG: hypothetical protein IKN49_00895 [Elusimicrobiaceae bacterium]|nr:hypothetical protein [Elusimicrobiaceae bacterium]
MKYNKRIFFISICLISCSLFIQAKAVSFTKEGTHIVPSNQSQDQVIAYLTQKLTREATEEAGIFIKSEMHIQEGNITKEEITNIAGSISKIKKEKVKTYTENGQQYVYMKLNVRVDTESVSAFLTKIKQDHTYKDEIERLRKENLQLEEKLRTANKQQFDEELSIAAKHQVEIQKQRALEYNKMALQAKEELAMAERSQQEQEVKRQQQIQQMQQQMEKDNLIRQQQIAKEKDELKKAELENQAQIKQLEHQAQMSSYQILLADQISIQQAVQEAQNIQQEIGDLTQKFNILQTNANRNLVQGYKQQENTIRNEQFTKREKPIKDAWETTDNYNLRVEQYRQDKANFETKKSTRLALLDSEKQAAIANNEKQILQAKQTAITPFVNKLKKMQQNYFPHANRPRATLVSIDEINADEQCFIMNISYEKTTYRLLFDFEDIGLARAKLLYQTKNQFIIEPLFQIDNKKGAPQAVVSSFRLTHSGTKLQKTLYLYVWIEYLPEIKQYTTSQRI